MGFFEYRLWGRFDSSALAGEILGFAGLVGAGRTETMRLVFGADTPDSGRIFINGNKVDIGCPADAIRMGICRKNRKIRRMVQKFYKTTNKLSAVKNRETGSFLSGLIDDVRIYNRAASP